MAAAELETMCVTADEINLLVLYRQMTPADKQLALVLLGRLCVGGGTEKVCPVNASNGSIVQIGDNNKAWSKAGVTKDGDI